MARAVVKLEAAERVEYLELLTGPFIKQVGSSTA